MARKGKVRDVSVRDLFGKTREELLDLARRMNVTIDAGTLRAGLIAALASALNRTAAGKLVVEAGRTAAASVARRAGKVSTAVKRTAGKAGSNGAAAKAAVKRTVTKAVKRTAATAGSVIAKAPVRRAAKAPAAAGAPVGGENPPKPSHADKVVHGTGEADSAKFSLSEKPSRRQFPPTEDLGDLPAGYSSERLFMLARDPYWMFLYWDFSTAKWDEIVRAGNGKPALRLLDVTDVIFDGGNAHRTIDYEIPYGAHQWYAYVNAPGRDFIAQMGSHGPRGFVPVVTSRRVTMPPDDFSANTDAQFVTIPIDVPFSRLREILAAHGGEGDLARVLARLQALGVRLPFDYVAGAGGGAFDEFTGPDGARYRRHLKGSEELLERLKREAAENVSSGAVTSFGSGGISRIYGGPDAATADAFFLEADVQVIVTGRTRPDARVTVGTGPVAVDAEGRFSVRAPLPDGARQFPIRAVSADERHRAGIGIDVTRATTKEGAP